ncbi:MAG: LamB/YcsF family protein [Verrucomicrobia bacterium]|jgi:UPF0271 protein|nr:LamB/YcsF family protein [Verrucomicrobiota bacterium]
MEQLIINCDLGENESHGQTRELLHYVDAANISCGVHAGSPEKTRSTIRRAQESGVLVGAHPGLCTAGGRGRSLPTVADFRQLLHDQVGAFRETAKALGEKVAYIKLHGSLYHAVEREAGLAESYLEFLRDRGQGMAVICRAGGSFAERCRVAGIQVYEEAFADRAYRLDGSLVPRAENGAVLSPDAALKRLRHWLATGEMATQEGGRFPLAADTLCVHGDSPGAVRLLREMRSFG